MYRFHSPLRLLSGLAAFLLIALFAAPAQAQEIGRSDYDVEALTYPELGEIETPNPQRIELDNGMIIFLLEDDELPLISASARVGTGGVYEPAEMVGLASVTGNVMRTGGTESMPADSINQVLETLGASVESGIGSTSGSVSMSTLAEHVDQVLPIFADVLRQPAFAQEKVDLAKNQQKSAISRRNDNATAIAAREMDKLIYGADSPYARTAEYYTIDRITREDVVDFYDTYYHPNNTILSVWGDFDADAMEERLREVFGDWQPAADFESPMPPAPEAERGRSVNFVQKDDVSQSNVRMGHVGELQRNSEDYPAALLMSEVLNAPFTGRLFRTLRTDRGLAYATGGVYSAGYTTPRRFFTLVRTQSGSTVEATQAMIDQVKGMQTNAPTAEEVSRAKDSYLNSFVFNFDTESEVLGRQMTYEYYGYPTDFLEQTRNALEQVTPDDVYRAAQQYLHPDESHILIVGRQQDFSQELSALTEGGEAVNEIDISIPTSPPGEGDAPAASAEDMAAGMEQLQAAKDALGGPAIDAVTNMQVSTETVAQTPMGEATITGTSTVTMDGKMNIEQTLPNGITITIVDDGAQMTIQTPQGTQPVPGQRRTQINSQIWRDMVYLMGNLDREGLEVQRMGTETVEGTTYETVKVTPPAGNPFTLYLNAETMRPERIDYTAVTQQGPQDATDVLADFQEVAGVMMPYETTTIQGGQERSVTTVTEATLNADLEGELFTISSE